MFYKFKLGLDASGATRNICCGKGEGTIGQGTVTRWFKKFCSFCKNLGDKIRLGRLKTGFRASTSNNRGKSSK